MLPPAFEEVLHWCWCLSDGDLPVGSWKERNKISYLSRYSTSWHMDKENWQLAESNVCNWEKWLAMSTDYSHELSSGFASVKLIISIKSLSFALSGYVYIHLPLTPGGAPTGIFYSLDRHSHLCNWWKALLLGSVRQVPRVANAGFWAAPGFVYRHWYQQTMVWVKIG